MQTGSVLAAGGLIVVLGVVTGCGEVQDRPNIPLARSAAASDSTNARKSCESAKDSDADGDLGSADAQAIVQRLQADDMTEVVRRECPEVLAELERIVARGTSRADGIDGGGGAGGVFPSAGVDAEPEDSVYVRVIESWQSMPYITKRFTVCEAWKTSHEEGIDHFVRWGNDATLPRRDIEQFLLEACVDIPQPPK